jgi:hypothetical protein
MTMNSRKEYGHSYYLKHKERIKTRTKRYRIEHSDYYKKYQKKYGVEHKKEKQEYRQSTGGKLAYRKCKLKLKYNMTVEQYDKMFEKQNGLCAICGRPQNSKTLAVDHNHNTGKIRGLLCSSCNTALGYIENWAVKFEKQIKEYLEKN